MAPLDTHDALPEISGSEPTGQNLEFDPDFAELERLSQGKPEQQYGATIVPAEEPDWKEVLTAAWTLTERTHDLRVLTLMAMARLHREGIAGYAATLTTIRHLLETRWAEVHPQLDPEDDNDPTLRANALLGLAEPGRVMRTLRNLPLARSPRVGTMSWRDISIATGAIEPDAGGEKPTEGMVAGAFRETDPAAIEALRGAIAACIASSVAIPAAFDTNAGFGTGPDFTDLNKLLREMARMLDMYAQSEAVEEEQAVETAVDEEAPAGMPVAAAAGRSAPAVSIATLRAPNNRADALRLLDLAVEFFEKNEPSSPLPMLISRARRLADKNFLEILRDIAPEGLSQAERIAGTTPDGYG